MKNYSLITVQNTLYYFLSLLFIASKEGNVNILKNKYWENFIATFYVYIFVLYKYFIVSSHSI